MNRKLELGLNNMSLRVLVRALAILGVVSILVHLAVLSSICGAMGLEKGYGKAEDIEFERRRASEPRAPQWFPDADLIAFSHAGVVYVIDSAGSRLWLIDGGGDKLDLAYAPSVSPDGSRIAYSAYKKSGWLPWDRTESWEIVTANPDGSDGHLLTKNDRLDVNPVWSPDGTSIFSVSVPQGSFGFRGISVAAEDGSDTPSVMKFVYPKGNHPVSGTPVLSPDGSRIAFLVDRIPSRNEMYVIETDGSGLTKLADETGLPAWSPDGQRIAFAKAETWDSRYPSGTAAGIYTIGLDVSEPQEIISFPRQSVDWVDSISWSPDGPAILFGPYIIEADGSAMRELPGPGNHASWSPDGSRIAVYAGSLSDVVLYTMARDGSDIRVLVEKAGDGSLTAAKGRPLRQL